MGRVKHYSSQHNKHHLNKKKKLSKQNNISSSKAAAADPEMKDNIEESKVQQVVTIGKKKQLFKRGKSKVIKAKIQELKAKSLKLKKKNLDQKAEKKKIAKEIHRLKASLKACEDIPKGGDASDSDDEEMNPAGAGALD